MNIAYRSLSTSLLLIGSSLAASGQSAKPAVSCESLLQLSLPQTTITMAQTVAAGEYKLPARNLPAGVVAPPSAPQPPNPTFCRVAATLKPSSDSDIKIEVWMPVEGWNSEFNGVANGGWAGTVAYSEMLTSLRRGFAASSTDTGHVSVPGQPNGSFIPGHPEKLVDYGHRSVHLMTVEAKQIIKAFYGVAAKYSVFTGCSLGGMQALDEASRFPEDYDGIVAGAPANPMTLFNAQQLWPGWLILQDASRKIPATKFKLIHEAAIKACAGPVGLAQGFIEDPANCHFDPKVLLCKGEDSAECLTAGQVDLMQKIYEGPINPRTKEKIFPGLPIGGELQLGQYTGERPMENAANLYRFAVYQDPNWDLKTMDYDTSIELARKVVDPQMKAGDNLNPFIQRGGKLMIYIGWTDYHNPLEVTGYYQRVLKNAGGGKAADSLRLFLIPGMDHCFGGAGCDTFDRLGTIAKWVESGKAPNEIPVAKLNAGQTVRTSTLCAYPQLLQYKGTGSIDAAENFVCSNPVAAKK